MTSKRLKSETGSPRSATPAERNGGMRLSMHDGVAVWCDCCSCEAEPYWVAVAGEPGSGGDSHEDANHASAHKK